MPTLNERIRQLETEITRLKSKIEDLSKNTEETYTPPYTTIGANQRSTIRPVDIKTGFGNTYSGFMPWNNAELKIPPYGTKPEDPTVGYHKHTHSEYAGGALNIEFLKLVEYDVNWETTAKYNPHCQQFWVDDPKIKIVQNSDGEDIKKIGLLDISFDADEGKWLAGSREINVETTYLVKRDENGNIETDAEGDEKKSALYPNNVVWDNINNTWRFYAIYSD